jgi:hypothetical protein
MASSAVAVRIGHNASADDPAQSEGPVGPDSSSVSPSTARRPERRTRPPHTIHDIDTADPKEALRSAAYRSA